MTGQLTLRTDATPEIGTGHLMRCLALAEAWQENGGTVTFVLSQSPSEVEERLIREKMNVLHVDAPPGSPEDAARTSELVGKSDGAWLVVDGYHFGAVYQRSLKGDGHRVLVWDDHAHADHYYADIVLNQNILAAPESYDSREPYTRLLLGTRYVVLRREFRMRGASPPRKQPEVARRVLVTLGGRDSHNVTTAVFKALCSAAIPDLEVTLVVGSFNTQAPALEKRANASRHDVRIIRHSEDMAGLMARADVAVSAAGSTCWELAHMGVPAIVLVLADNQVETARGLDEAGAAINLGWHSDLTRGGLERALSLLVGDSKLRGEMARKGSEIVDGRGAERVARVMRREPITIRPVEESDCDLLWRWVNDPSVRAASFSSDPISLDSHRRWFSSALRSHRTHIYIAQDHTGEPVGQVRFDREGDEATVDVSIAPARRGEGLSSLVIRRGTEVLFEDTTVRAVNAFIKEKNVPSVRAFEKSGYTRVSSLERDGVSAIHYKRPRDRPAE